ncbi:unnamed protein product [Trypanosoma congolense IL3000]|uniref:WGS project CAEQ00000000 data, annotated contig 1300 n=1 Tax=Trypanosoma congolense (strain IL3000) TaxID=1068625 RepID=F9W5A7_TRYCI|nr:unnamed protein product [Trypanosoma congolense IL3000]
MTGVPMTTQEIDYSSDSQHPTVLPLTHDNIVTHVLDRKSYSKLKYGEIMNIFEKRAEIAWQKMEAADRAKEKGYVENENTRGIGFYRKSETLKKTVYEEIDIRQTFKNQPDIVHELGQMFHAFRMTFGDLMVYILLCRIRQLSGEPGPVPHIDKIAYRATKPIKEEGDKAWDKYWEETEKKYGVTNDREYANGGGAEVYDF